jgi:RNA polymerase sigma-70 factor (ECF subfamily)
VRLVAPLVHAAGSTRSREFLRDFGSDRRKREVRNDIGLMRKENATTIPVESPSGFSHLYERTVTDVFSYLASRVGDWAAAEDLTQDVFVAGARRDAAGDVVDLAWLIGVARHKLVDHWRAQARHDRNLALVHSSEQTHPVEESGTIDPDRASVVLAGLNPTYRAALVLRHVDGLSVSAVAGHLQRSVEATEQVLSRARAAFRDKYQGAIGE